MAETWKKIPGYETRYEVSDWGNVRILPYTTTFVRKDTGKTFEKFVKGRTLRPRLTRASKTAEPQPHINVYNPVTRKNRQTRVAFLVAAAHLGLPYDRSDQRDLQQWRIRHKDGNLKNNFASNLEWVHKAGNNTAHEQDFYNRNLDAFRARVNETAWDNALRYYDLQEAVAMFREDGREDEIPVRYLAVTAVAA